MKRLQVRLEVLTKTAGIQIQSRHSLNAWLPKKFLTFLAALSSTKNSTRAKEAEAR